MNENQEILHPSMIEMTAGEMLKNARTTGRRKREIATIAKLLCIREDFLVALEEGNYRFIPEDVYILGFARNYAIELGIDPDVIVDKIKHELGLVSEIEEEKEETKKVVINQEKNSVKELKELFLDWYKKTFEFVKQYWKWFLIGFGIIIFVCLLVVIVPSSAPTASSNVSDNSVVEEKVIKEPNYTMDVREKFETKNRAETRVVLQAIKESWVKIEDIRGNTIFSRVLVPGDVYFLPSGDKYKGTFGNVAGIDIWVDGHLINKLGPANTRKTGVSLSPDALKSVGFAE